MLKTKISGILMSVAVGVTALSGCAGLPVNAGLTSASSSAVLTSESETTAAVTSEATGETKQTVEPSENEATEPITKETIKAKIAALKTGEHTFALGVTYLGESENQAVMEVVLAEMGVDEELLKDTSRFIDCSGSDLWLICISDDVNALKVTVGEDENGNELYKAEKGKIPDYIFVRCFSSGEMSSCTVCAEGKVTGNTAYFPIMIAEQIVVPNGGTVVNQTKGYETYIDVPGEPDDSNEPENTDETEEEVP